MSSYIWITPAGDKVDLDQSDIDALALIHKVFPGSRATWWRRPDEDLWTALVGPEGEYGSRSPVPRPVKI